jgi:hypothetical protein
MLISNKLRMAMVCTKSFFKMRKRVLKRSITTSHYSYLQERETFHSSMLSALMLRNVELTRNMTQTTANTIRHQETRSRMIDGMLIIMINSNTIWFHWIIMVNLTKIDLTLNSISGRGRPLP